MVLQTEAFVTLVTSDEYGIGAIVLAHSLKDAGTSRKVVCLHTQNVTPLMGGRLRDVFDEVILVEPIRSNSTKNLDLLGRPDLLYTFTKLQLWKMTQFSKVVFLDADTLVLKNVDELFEKEEFSASPDIGWPDCFNSGVFVAAPSLATYTKLIEFSEQKGSFDGGDQGLLNDFFPNWYRLSFLYNVTPSASYSYAPAYQRHADQIKIVHFIGEDKPWKWDRYSSGGVMPRGRNLAATGLVQKWWDMHDKHLSRWTTTPSADQPYQYPGYQPRPGHHEPPQYQQAEQSPANPFFKSRYDWNEQELKMTSPATRKITPAKEEETPIPFKNKAAAKPAQHAASSFQVGASKKK